MRMAAKRRGRRTRPEGITMKVIQATAKLKTDLQRRTWGIALGGALLVIIWLARVFVELLGP
jgi:hypothetical protein